MILSDKTLMKLLSDSTIEVSPIDEGQVQPASIDVRLGMSFTVPIDIGGVVSMSDATPYRETLTKEFLLLPGDFVLATTMERVKLPDNIAAFVEGRSSLGRLGLFIQNAGWVDPGFEGEITLELFNAGRNAIKLVSGRRIAQLVFAMMDQEVENPYRGKYQGQRGATGSRVHLDSDK